MTEIVNATDPQRLALAASAQATEAVAELLRFAREGEDIHGPYGEIEVVEKLLDAAKLAIEVLGEKGERYWSIYGDIKHELEFWV